MDGIGGEGDVLPRRRRAQAALRVGDPRSRRPPVGIPVAQPGLSQREGGDRPADHRGARDLQEDLRSARGFPGRRQPVRRAARRRPGARSREHPDRNPVHARPHSCLRHIPDRGHALHRRRPVHAGLRRRTLRLSRVVARPTSTNP